MPCQCNPYIVFIYTHKYFSLLFPIILTSILLRSQLQTYLDILAGKDTVMQADGQLVDKDNRVVPLLSLWRPREPSAKKK